MSPYVGAVVVKPAPEFVGGEFAATGGAATLAVNKPANVTTGSLLVFHVFWRFSTQDVTSLPSGVTVVDQQNGQGDIGEQAVYRKVAGASEPSSYSFTVSSTQMPWGIGLVAYDHAGSPENTVGFGSDSTDTIVCPSISPSVPGCLVVCAMAVRGASQVSGIATPAGTTARLEFSASATQSPPGTQRMKICDYVHPTASATGTKSAAITAFAGSEPWLAHHVAFPPA